MSERSAVLARVTLERELREGIPRGELVLLYQPKVDSWTGRVVGTEALVRWKHPVRGLLAPASFIALAEESRLIVDLDAWVLETACVQASAWARSPTGPLSIAVNVSGRDLEGDGLLERVRCVLDETGLDARLLELELTESVALQQHEGRALSMLREIRSLGVRIAIDDFGTGYSMLSRLQDFPFDTLKIDRSFISRITSVDSDSPIVAATVAMARGLGLAIVAEGVETDEQRMYLVRQGGGQLQGYLISHPVAPELIPQMVRVPPLRQIEDPRWAALDCAIDVVNTEPAFEDLVRALLLKLQGLTGLDSVYLTQFHWDRDEQEVLFSLNSGSITVPEHLILGVQHRLSRRTLTAGTQYRNRARGDFPEVRTAAVLGHETSISVPVLLGDGRFFGALCGASGRHVPLAQAGLEAMRVFASVIAAQISAPTATTPASHRTGESPVAHSWEPLAREPRHETGDQRELAGDKRDQAGDARDEAGDQRDQAGDVRDEAGDRRDHAGDERDQASDRRDEAGDQRDEIAQQRDQAAGQRDQAAVERDQAADQRDQAADQRDQAGEQRDQAADRRDQAAEQSEGHVIPGRTTNAHDRAALARHEGASDRGGASRDRRAGQGERRQAALDRDTALADRGAGVGDRRQAELDRDIATADRAAGAGERLKAELDRSTAMADRGAGASERTQAELDRDTALADRGASAKERRQAAVDVLTGVYLRGAGFAALEREVDRARRTGRRLVLAFIDVDGLKDINDSQGHAAGDRMLVAVANTFREMMRSYDLIIRYGGDEFVCAISDLTLADATARLDLVNAALAHAPEHGSVTFGLAELHPDDVPADLVARADAALYRERQRRGRSRR